MNFQCPTPNAQFGSCETSILGVRRWAFKIRFFCFDLVALCYEDYQSLVFLPHCNYSADGSSRNSRQHGANHNIGKSSG